MTPIDRILSYNPDFSHTRNMLAQYKAMTWLKENNSVVIKKADKCSNVVIQNISDYTEGGLRQLEETAFYQKISWGNHRKLVQDLVSDLFLHKEVTEKTLKFLLRGGHRTSVFYMLPKIHKNKFPVPGRPIVSSYDSPTEKISKMLDIILQPYVLHTSSYIRDTSNFLEKVKNLELNSNDWIFTMDVMSLYMISLILKALNASEIYFNLKDRIPA